jgi:hypothetical protein
VSSNIRAQIVERGRHGTLLEAIFGEYGRQWFNNDDPTIVALADLHNAGEIDILGIVTPEAIEPYKGHAFFGGQHVYCSLICRLNARADTLLTVVQTLIEAAGQDMAAGLPVEEFAKWCGLDRARPAELLALVDDKFPNADRFLTIAVKNGAKIDRDHFLSRAYEFLSTGTEIQKQGAINALGQVELVGDDDWRRWVAAVEVHFTEGQSDLTNATILTAIGRRLKGAPAEYQDALIELGIKIAETLGDQALDTAARTVAFDLEDLPERLLDALLSALTNVKTVNVGTIKMLDLALMKLIETGHADRARRLIEPLIQREDEPVDPAKFDSCWYKLREIGGDVQKDWIVAWLLDGDYALCKALDDALFQAGSDEIALTIDFTRYMIRAIDYPYLARKAIATFFLKTQLMASILVSLLRSAPGDGGEAIVDLLVDPVLLNYSGVGEAYLKPIADDVDDPAQPHVGRALEGLETYLEALRSIGSVPELRPSERERTIESQRHADSMAEAFRQVRRKSVFASIVTESVMLYGTRSVSWVPDRNKAPRRIETALATISHSIEVPRVDIVDPMGLQLMLIRFRGEERPA